MSDYVAWIPTIIGNLSYKLVGQTGYPSMADVCSYEKNSIQTYIVAQKRITHDFQVFFSAFIPSKRLAKRFESWFMERQHGIISTFYTLLVGECCAEPEGSPSFTGINFQIFKGTVYFIPICRESSDLVEEISKTIARINNYTADGKLSPDTAENLKEQLCKGINECVDSTVRVFSILSCELKLTRDGVCQLTNYQIFDSDPLYASEVTLQSLSEHEGVDQTFFFLKDIFHSHKFHDPDHDTLTKTYIHKGSKDTVSDFGWAKETLKDLYRNAIRLDAADSIGIIYYAKAFKDIIKKKSSSPGELNDGYSFLDKDALSDQYAEDLCKARIEISRQDGNKKAWRAGLFASALLLTWNRTAKSILEDFNLTTLNEYYFSYLVPFLIMSIALIYVEKIDVNKLPPLNKFVKWISARNENEQLCGILLTILFGLGMVWFGSWL